MTTNPAVNDPEVLEALYWHKDLSAWEIADRLGESERTIREEIIKHGIDKRKGELKNYTNRGSSSATKAPKMLHDAAGYEVFSGKSAIDGFSTTFVHQITLIMAGEDPRDVYAEGNVVHHKNGIKWDNRPENLQLMTRSDHGEHHAESRDFDHTAENWYTDDELLSWIEVFVEEFGVVPSCRDAKNWPGPSTSTYRNRFGSWAEAVERAGYEPRGNQ